MKAIRWNLGIILLAFGYVIREKAIKKTEITWRVGAEILRFAYWLRGNIPRKHWGKWVHCSNLQNSISKYL